VLELAYEHMNEPEKLVVESEFITNAKVRQLVYFPSDEDKIPLLIGLLTRSEGHRTMVFVNTKVWVERVARGLERAGFRVGVLSGDVPQKKRETLLARFQKGQLDILVATDVAARGLHIDGVSHVYNYDLPFDAEDYVHRIGRTARLGAEGDAISFACERYAMSLPDIEAYIEQKLPVASVEPELLIPKPRAPRERVEGEDEGEIESVSAIFREVREAKAAEDERRGVSRGGRSGGGGRDGGRAGGGSRERSGPRPGAQRERKPAPAAAALPPVVEAPVDPTRPASRPAPSSPMQADPNAPARKRRRRRGGRPVGEGAAAEAGAKPRTSEAAPKAAAAGEKPSLLGRIKAGLKSLVKRNPPTGH
jgi:ATP-dependent RNA helicase RhlB